jgi:hypothetical protein
MTTLKATCSVTFIMTFSQRTPCRRGAAGIASGRSFLLFPRLLLSRLLREPCARFYLKSIFADFFFQIFSSNFSKKIKFLFEIFLKQIKLIVLISHCLIFSKYAPDFLFSAFFPSIALLALYFIILRPARVRLHCIY